MYVCLRRLIGIWNKFSKNIIWGNCLKWRQVKYSNRLRNFFLTFYYLFWFFRRFIFSFSDLYRLYCTSNHPTKCWHSTVAGSPETPVGLKRFNLIESVYIVGVTLGLMREGERVNFLEDIFNGQQTNLLPCNQRMLSGIWFSRSLYIHSSLWV